MSGRNTAVSGLYPDETELVEAIDQLLEVGFRATDLATLLPENLGSKDIGHEKDTKAPEGAVAGGIVGAAVGGTLGWLSNLGIVAPWVDGAGTLTVSILTGVGALGFFGASVGALLGACTPEYEAKRYEGRTHAGGILLSVHCDNTEWCIRAKNVLVNTGARSISAAREAKADFARGDKPMLRAEWNGSLKTHRRLFLDSVRPVTLSETSLPLEMHEIERRPAD